MRLTILALLAAALAGCAGETPVSVEEAASGDDEAPWWAELPREGWRGFARVDVPEDQDWFEVYRVAPGTWALLEPGQWQEVISWLIEGEERALLFDTGLGIGDPAPLVAALTDRPVTVLNSHTHLDHVGANHRFERILGTDHPFAVANRDGADAEETRAFLFAEGAVWKPLPAGVEPGRLTIPPFEVDGLVEDGDVIDLGGRQLSVLATPGHSPDGLTLHDEGAGILFVGDTFYPAPLYAHLPGSDFDAYRASAARLAALAPEIELVATGHNEPVRGGAILVEVHRAFEAVADGRSPDEARDGVAVHQFGTFSILRREEA
jgi:glyoxylase-like metal-dependent hydrolase (beta-lactamase superfamily II)